ncbi:hypothetical protein J4573_18795 [Actinomadura barringtoniae]|uniref:Uncharacterized protein n=1 Tax=Actinomadura barringtoniae TaxID=1427535 RepID=A0A939PG67_9ACTN|nr:hypothetical protein [Actinomadura barringtoniae]MBO2449159.1 hypothetical protein [Actinomadura barringtoniae]
MVDGPPLADLAELIQKDRLEPAEPARIGKYDVLIEHNFVGVFVYQIRGDRVLMFHAGKGYREDVAVALLDAVDDIADTDDLGSIVRLRPIDVPGFALDRAALLGPGHTGFFKDSPLKERGLQVIPVHRSEAIDGEEYEAFWPGIIGKNLALRHHHWDREPTPRADVRRLDGGMGGLYRKNSRSRRSSKPALAKARSVLERDLPGMPNGVRVSVKDMRGHDLHLNREFDRLRGTLTLQVQGKPAEPLKVDIPRHSAWAVFGPLFRGEDFDPDALNAQWPPEHMLMMRVGDKERRRYDSDERPASLEECLRWLDALAPTDGNYLVFVGRSEGVVQMRWEGPDKPKLWLETPEPAHRHSRGRYVTTDEAATMIRTLARENRVAVDDLGDLETTPWNADSEEE